MRANVPPLRAVFMSLVGLLAANCGGGPTPPVDTHPHNTQIVVLALAGRPHGVATSRPGTFYISQIDGNTVTRGTVSPSGQSFTGIVPVGSAPAHVAMDPAGTRAYTTNQFGNSVSVVDAATNTNIGTIPLSDGGFNLITSPSGDRVYATTASGLLHVIDASTQRVITVLGVGAAANGLAYNGSTGVLYVSARDAGTVTAVDTHTNSVTRTYGVSASPQRIALSPTGSELYIASESVGLEVLDLSTGTRTTVPGVAPGAVGLALSPDGSVLFVTNPPDGLVQIVDRASRTVTASITAAVRPRNVAFSYDGSTALITDEAGAVVFVR